jgi:GNAT acetyltransferase
MHVSWRPEVGAGLRMSTPDLQLQTGFVLNAEGRITSTREPVTNQPPAFLLIRSATSCAWALRADVPGELAGEVSRLAREEPLISDLRQVPVHAERYVSLLGDRVESGPAFTFPDTIVQPADVVIIQDERLLQRNFQGWVAGELAAGRSPAMAIVEEGCPVSVCFCARRSDVAAEAGLETAEEFRGRGFGPRVTAAWALAIRASGRIPLYSTSWRNDASLMVARKLGLIPYASDWSIFGSGVTHVSGQT